MKKVLVNLNKKYHKRKKKEIKTFFKNMNQNQDNNSNSRPRRKFL